MTKSDNNIGAVLADHVRSFLLSELNLARETVDTLLGPITNDLALFATAGKDPKELEGQLKMVLSMSKKRGIAKARNALLGLLNVGAAFASAALTRYGDKLQAKLEPKPGV